ncbi:MAG TPA: Lrp/AsnC family transcriptional regulator [Conexibacter sp.]|jgi:DNA-binding Lrp family transcriptional regulator
MSAEEVETITIDRLDRRLIHALMRDGRLPFRRIAEALGSSEQTVARRYRRLREAGVVRVIVIRNPRRYRENTFVRIRTKPGAARLIGETLARRDDVGWVTLAAGGTEVTCSLRSDDPRDRDALILERLPKVSRVTDVSSATLLHVFSTGTRSDWHALDDGLTADELAELGARPPRPAGLEAGADAPLLGPEDDELMQHLARDGRMTYAALAAATGRREAAVARRVDTLLERGTLFASTELAAPLLGFRTTATLWLTVAPSALERVGVEVSDHPEVEFAGAVSGQANLVVAATCRDSPDLYRYLTRRLGAIEAIQQLEVVVAVRRLKQAGTVMEGERLPSPLT